MIELTRIMDLCERLGVTTMGRDFGAIAERAAREW